MKKKIFLGILIFLLLIAGIMTFLVKHYLSKVNYDDGQEPVSTISEEDLIAEFQSEESNDETETDSAIEDIEAMDKHLESNVEADTEALDSKNVYNLMLIGCDSRKKNGGGRSDAMILVSINKEKETMYLTSIMRDIYTSIPGYKNNRLNAAFAFGGASLLLDTVEQNFGIPVDKYAKVDFYSFADIIDILGGVDMKVTDEEVTVMNRYIKEMNRLKGRAEETYQLSGGGNLHLNGTQALSYARIRYVGHGDFGRTDRQRKILQEVFDKAKSADIGTLKNLLEAVLPMITTNLDEGEILSLAMKIPAWLDYEMESQRIPVDGSYQFMRVRGMSVLGIDFEKNREYLEELIYE